jgi:sigma-B regulation protein RsbU (phosphoserine phosphatase)
MFSKATDTSPTSGTQAGKGPAPQPQKSAKADILIVDDVPANLHLLSEMLTRQGYKVRSAINGHMALMATRAAPPDLILLDINMPGMNGYEVCEHLRADEDTRDIPIIFISALDETQDKVKAFTVGGRDYVTKPFQLEEVLARVETHLALQDLQAELQQANDELERRVEERTAQVVQLAVEKGQMEHELHVAREVQASFLPRKTPQLSGWEFVARWRPAREVAGDYYDFIPRDDGQLSLVIADAAGKGMPAALFMVLTRSIVRASVDRAPSPAKGIARANRLLCADASEGMFVTLFYALVNPATSEITYVNAGHNPPLHYRADQEQLTQLEPTGMVLGVMADTPFEQRTVHLQPGDFFVLYTDGVPDATDAQERGFGMERLQDVILDHGRAPAVDIVAALEQAIDDFAGPGDPFDDIAIVVAKRL